MAQPAPFEIVDAGDGLRVASNGQARLTLLDSDGRLFKRRGVKGLSPKPAAEQLLPLINNFAGELLSNPEMNAVEVMNKLMALAGTLHVSEPQNVEWVVAELDGVRVYVDGNDIVVTRQDLAP